LDGLNATEAARQAAEREANASLVVRRPPAGGLGSSGAGLGGISALNSASQV
jgi:hypothetical protein